MLMVVAVACQTYHYDCAAHYKNFLFTFYTFLLCGNQGLRHQVKRHTRAATQEQQHNSNTAATQRQQKETQVCQINNVIKEI